MPRAAGRGDNVHGGEGSEARPFARKFEEMLRRFPPPGGGTWKPRRIAEETAGEPDEAYRLTESYLSRLRSGEISQPSLPKLDSISRVLGAPFDLWRIDPDEWDAELERRGFAVRKEPKEPDSPLPSGADLAAKVNRLFEQVPKRSGRPYTNSEVAALSSGRLTEEEVSLMRSNRYGTPTKGKLLGFCNAFDVPFSYWTEPVGPARPALSEDDARRLRALIEEAPGALPAAARSTATDDGQLRDAVMVLVQHLLGEARVGRGDADEDRAAPGA